MRKASKLALVAALALAIGGAPTAIAADGDNEPASLDADVVEYDMQSGLVTATTNVLMKKGETRVAGQKAVYNHKTQQGTVTGGVIAVRGDMRMTCEEMISDGPDHMKAVGNVHGTQLDRSFSGDQVDYFPNANDYVLMAQGGLVTNQDGTFTAAKMEGWLKDEHYVGTGNAHLVSPPRNLEAGGDRMDYLKPQDGTRPRVVATGNAWAVQDNNTVRGNHLTIYLAEDNQATVE